MLYSKWFIKESQLGATMLYNALSINEWLEILELNFLST